MFRRLRLAAAALAALACITGARAEPEPAQMCWRGPLLYAQGEHRQAFRNFMGCAIAGDVVAQYNAAMMMRSGESNEDGEPNPFGARVFLEQAASQGFGQAVYVLGKEYDVGSVAFERDVNFATELFRLAALQGHVDAQVDLATQYLLGRGGVPQDDETAAIWYERAALAGHWGAQYLIASMYEHGTGVHRDASIALQWYERAQQGGDEVAPLKVQQLRIRLATDVRRLRLD
jgi:uncharacterized protein